MHDIFQLLPGQVSTVACKLFGEHLWNKEFSFLYLEGIYGTSGKFLSSHRWSSFKSKIIGIYVSCWAPRGQSLRNIIWYIYVGFQNIIKSFYASFPRRTGIWAKRDLLRSWTETCNFRRRLLRWKWKGTNMLQLYFRVTTAVLLYKTPTLVYLEGI